MMAGMAEASENDMTRRRASADQVIAVLEDKLKALVAEYESLRMSGMGRTDAICKLGANAHDQADRQSVAMAMAVAVAQLADYPGDIRGPA